MQSAFIRISVLTGLLLGLPMLGIVATGADVHQYLEFPPSTRYVNHAPFSWSVLSLTAAVGLLTLAGLLWLMARDRQTKSHTASERVSDSWPLWGWLGLMLLFGSWVLAWNRFSWFADWQTMTFAPLWLGYILVINAWTMRRTGRCPLINNRRRYLMLFPLSSLFWWYFEYLNRFVQNWLYIGVDDFGPARYVLHATVAFSTVLPAVIGTRHWLASFIRPPVSPLALVFEERIMHRTSWLVLCVASLALLLLGIWPNLLFPFLWFAPLLLLLALQGIYGDVDFLEQLRDQGWQAVYLPALAALQCGFFWELWNYYSAAKWIYTVPFVQRFQVFEMPVVGFTGYLPFGIECAAIALLLGRDRGTRS